MLTLTAVRTSPTGSVDLEASDPGAARLVVMLGPTVVADVTADTWSGTHSPGEGRWTYEATSHDPTGDEPDALPWPQRGAADATVVIYGATDPYITATPRDDPALDGWKISLVNLPVGNYRLVRYNRSVAVEVRGASKISITTAGTAKTYYDYDVPLAADFKYRLVNNTTAVVVADLILEDWIFIDTATPVIKAQSDSKVRRMAIAIQDETGIEYPTRTAVHYVIDRADPVGVGNIRQLGRGTLTFKALTVDERNELLNIVREGETILLRTPCSAMVDDKWFYCLDVREERADNRTGWKYLSVDYQRVQQPVEEEITLQQSFYADVPALWDYYVTVRQQVATYERLAVTTQPEVEVLAVESLAAPEDSVYAGEPTNEQIWARAIGDA